MSLFRIAGVVAGCTAAGAGAAAAQSSGTIMASVTVTSTAVSEANVQLARSLSSNPAGQTATRVDSGTATVTADNRRTAEETRAATPAVTIIYW